MTSNFIFLLFALNAAISRHLCVCQPDRPGSVCTLSQKCNKFLNENQILLINQNNQFRNTSEVDIFQVCKDIISEGHSTINLKFDVYGSLKSQPIIFNFAGSEKLSSLSNDLRLSISIKGGEWKQIINFAGFNSISSSALSKISLSLEDISVLFDTNNTSPISANSFSFDSFKIQKSRLIVPPGEYVSFNAHDLYTDTVSSFSDFNGKIIVDHLSYFDTEDPEIINNFNSPFQLKNETAPKYYSKTGKNKAILEDEPTSEEINNFMYSFCLTSKNRLDRALEDTECEMHSVPADLQHYINVKSEDVLDIISKAPSGKTIRFFLTSATSVDPCSLVLPDFVNSNISIVFQIADPDIPTYLNLKVRDHDPEETLKKNIFATFTSIQTFNIDVSLLSSFSNVTLKSSQMFFADSRTNASVHNLTTDSDSISAFEGSLYIIEAIELKKTTPKKINGNIFLQDHSFLIVLQFSSFPHVLLKKSADGNYYIALTDSLEYVEMKFYFGEYRIDLFFKEDSVSNYDVIDVTFRNDIRDANYNRTQETPEIYISTLVPQSGLNVTIGDESAEDEYAWPKRTIFYFEGGFNKTPDEYPLVYLSINDLKGITNSSTSMQLSFFMVFHYVSVYVYGYQSFHPFLDGINANYKNVVPNNCPIDIYFTNPLNRCYQVSVFNVGNATLNIGDSLSGVLFEDDRMYFNTPTDQIETPPVVFGLITLITTSTNVEYDVVEGPYKLSKTQRFTLNPQNDVTANFTDLFVDIYDNYYDLSNKLQILHESRKVVLKANNKPIPFISLDDEVQGVCFDSSPMPGTQIISINNKYFETQSGNTRKGPVVRVDYSEAVDVPQSAFLANQVGFRNTKDSPVNMNFYYWGETVCDYTFEKTIISIMSKDSWPYKSTVLDDSSSSTSNVDFKAKSVILDSTSKIANVDSVNLKFEVNQLEINSISSIPSSSFAEPIIVHDRVIIEDNTITRIVFRADSVQIYSNDLSEGTAIVRCIPLAPASQQEEPSESSARLLDATEDVSLQDASGQNGISIKTDTNQPIELSVDGSSVPDNFNLDLAGTDPQIVLDKSWNNVQVPDNFQIEATNSPNGKYNLETDLVELPNNFPASNANVSHRKQKLTKDVGFIIFIVIFAVVFVIGIILCIYGLTCYPQEEQYDMSSEVNGADLIEDENDSDIDRSYESPAEVENVEREINDANEPTQEKEQKRKETKNEETTSAIEQKPSGDVESDTDSNFFDEADNDTTEKSKVK